MQSYSSQIIRILEKITAAGADEAQIFDDFLDMAYDSLEQLPNHVKSMRSTGQLTQDPPEMVKRWERLRSRYKGKYYFDLFAKALAILMSSAEDDWHDTIGEVYMEFGHPSKRGGQYFTPFSLAKMMSSSLISMQKEGSVPQLVHERIKMAYQGDPLAESLLLTGTLLKGGDAEDWYFNKLLPAIAYKVEPVTIHDPACGSGVMFLAAASEIPRWMLDWGFVRFSGQDIDQTCVQMAKVNMMLYGLNGYSLKCAAAVGESVDPIEIANEWKVLAEVR